MRTRRYSSEGESETGTDDGAGLPVFPKHSVVVMGGRLRPKTVSRM